MGIVVLGAGPTGLGAAWQLNQRKHADWQIYERMDRVGGLSTSYVDNEGFTWDVGGHVLFSHFETFDAIVEEALGDGFYSHQRESWVRSCGTWVPYPFQNNVRYLSHEARNECLEGLKNLQGDPASTINFQEWMNAIFGEGIVKYFMAPYNFKVWATPPELMSKDWIAERVSLVDLERIKCNIREKRDDVAWGPNNLFKFPRKGGTGAIYEEIARPFNEKIHFGYELVEVDLLKKRLSFSNGYTSQFDALISTIPLDMFVNACAALPDEIRSAADKLVHNSVYVVGIGLQQKRTDSKCWMYFPEDNCPFYRVTNFHNYSPCNVPNGDVAQYSALMCEVSFSAFKPVDRDTVIEDTIQGLISAGMMNESDRDLIVSRHLIEVPYAYPVPTVDRDEALAVIQPFLEQNAVYSRGRFGAWKYEIGNMDHSFMQGIEIAGSLSGRGVESVFTG